MKPITQLEQKYLIVKADDLKYLDTVDRASFIESMRYIQDGRKKDGKPSNHYVVLNLSDKVDIQRLIIDLEGIDAHTTFPKFVDVDEIATTLINAILSTQEK